jgi:hypothetical protein
MTESIATFGVSLQARVAHAPQLVSADLGGETAILDPVSGHFYGLNQVGARIWELIATLREVAEVRDILLQEFDVDLEQCEGDLLTLLQTLHGRRLVVMEEPVHA